MSISEVPFASLISGGGSTMEALGRACLDGGPLYGKAKLVTVIASTPDAPGLQKARPLGITNSAIINPKDYRTPEAFGEAIIRHLNAFNIQLVFQNGWMPKTPANVIGSFPGRIYNQHPAPVPEFGGKGMYGRRPHAARLLFARIVQGDFWTCAITQRVAPDFDAGAVVHRQTITILPTDDPITLQQRVLPVEHQVQIEALGKIIDGTAVELPPDEPLAKTIEEKMILDTCKRYACLLFPNG